MSGTTESLTIRRATRDDLPFIIALLVDDPLGAKREAAGGQDDGGYLAAFEDISRDARQFLMVVEKRGRVVGTCQLTIIPYLTYRGGRRAQIEAVRVTAGERGAGIGRRLFSWAIEEARRQGCHMVQLTTDKRRPDALRFYQALGFAATHEGMKLHLDEQPPDA